MVNWRVGSLISYLFSFLTPYFKVMDTAENREKLKTAQINNALGLFIFVFGIIVIFAMIFANTFIQKMTDLAAGLSLVIIGGGMMLKSRKTIKRLK